MPETFWQIRVENSCVYIPIENRVKKCSFIESFCEVLWMTCDVRRYANTKREFKLKCA